MTCDQDWAARPFDRAGEIREAFGLSGCQWQQFAAALDARSGWDDAFFVVELLERKLRPGRLRELSCVPARAFGWLSLVQVLRSDPAWARRVVEQSFTPVSF